MKKEEQNLNNPLIWNYVYAFKYFWEYILMITFRSNYIAMPIQEAQGPRVAHLSDIATEDMQMLCNIFPILSCN